MTAHSAEDLQRIYDTRFAPDIEYRRSVWRVLIDDYFQRFIQERDVVLDLGSGYGEFINQVRCGGRFAMDLNPDAATRVRSDVVFLLEDCSQRWSVGDHTLDIVFTSNFFEHLPDKSALGRTLDEVRRCLKPGGRLIAMGPNIKFTSGAYWDFWDHHLPLTELSLQEALKNRGFEIEAIAPRFLPYRMAGGPHYPLPFLRAYLRLPFAWRLFGKQFVVVGRVPPITLMKK